MKTKKWMKLALVPAGVLALCSPAGAVDCTTRTVTCNTFLKGSAKFKPFFTNIAVDTCTTSPTGVEAITIKGKVSGCTVSGVGAPVIKEGTVKGTLYTGDCSCAGLTQPNNLVVAPPPGKTNNITTKWKFQPAPSPQCDPGQNESILLVAPGVGGIDSGIFSGPAANANFNPTALYGAFTVNSPGVGVSGIFQGVDLGVTSSTTGATSESLATLLTTCAGAPGLKGVTFGQADVVLK